MQVVLQGSCSFLLISFFQQTSFTGGAGLCTWAIRWLCCENTRNVAESRVMLSVLAEVHGLDACSQPCSKMIWQEVCHGIGLHLVQMHMCTQGCTEAGELKLAFYLIFDLQIG